MSLYNCKVKTVDDIIPYLENNPGEGIDMLINWARENCLERQLYYELVFLKSKYNTAFEKNEREAIKNEMIALANRFSGQDLTASREEFKTVTEKRSHFIHQGTSNEIVVECINAGKKYERTQFELSNVNIQLRLGEITGVVGENGNGKTTLLRLLSGRLKNTMGEITFNPKFIIPGSIDSLQREIAFLPQEPDKVYGKVLTSIQLSASVYGIHGEENEFEVDYIIHRLGLTEYKHVYWNELSGGYKVRFALARILVRNPRILILDEPLANLDHNAQNKLLADLRDISYSLHYPVSVVISSQQLAEIEAIADNMVYLSRGKVLYSGSTSAIGSDRTENCYEIRTALSRVELAEKLRHLSQFRLEFTGITYLLTTPTDLSCKEILNYFVKHEIPVQDINDISRSTKRVLYKLNEASI